MLVRSYDVRVVAEAMTSEEIVKFIGAKISVTPAISCVRGILWTDVWLSAQLLVGIIYKYPLG